MADEYGFSVYYEFNAVDNVSPAANAGAASEEKLAVSAEKTQRAVDSQNISFIKTVTSMAAVRSGYNGITNGLAELDIVGGRTERTMRRVGAGIDVIVGTAQLLKGVSGLVTALKNSEIALAAVESYRAVLKSPAKMGLILAGAATAGAVAGYLYGSTRERGGGGGGTTENNVNINYNGMQPGSDTRGATRSTLEMMGA